MLGIDLVPHEPGEDAYIGDEIVVVASVMGTDLVLGVDAHTNGEPLGVFPISPALIQRPALAVQLPEPGGEPGRPEIIVAARDADRVIVVDGSWPAGWLDIPGRREVLLANGGTVDGPLQALHLNVAGRNGESGIACGMNVQAPADTFVDLAVPGSAGPYFAFGTADGHFHSDPCALADPLLVPDDVAAPPDAWAPVDCPTPLRIGHLDGDAVPDIVTPDGVWLSQAGAAPCDLGAATVAPLGKLWTEAAIADFTGDGLDDLVVGTAAAEIEFYGNGGGAVLSHAVIATIAPVESFEVGDYDGNGLADLAFLEESGGQMGDALSVVFGRPYASPSAPLRLGSLPDVFALDKMNRAIPGESWVDTMEDLSIGSSLGPDESRFGFLYGRADGHLQAPFTITYNAGMDAPNFLTPLAVRAGRYPWSTAENGLAVIARQPYPKRGTPPTHLCAVDAPAITTLETVALAPAEVDDTGVASSIAATLVVAAAAIDDGGLDQPVVLESRPSGLVVTAPTWGAEGWSGTDAVELPGARLLGAAGTDETDVPLSTAQLDALPCAFDADGAQSLLFSVVRDGESSVGAVLGPEVIAAIRDGSGVGAADLVTIPAPEGGDVVAIGCIELDGTPGREVAVAVLKPGEMGPIAQLWAVEPADWTARPLATLDASMLPALVPGAGIARLPLGGLATGAVTGDGVDDVVALAATTILVLPGKAVLP
jgi:hypothetical protein